MTRWGPGRRGAVRARNRAPLGMCRFLHTGSGAVLTVAKAVAKASPNRNKHTAQNRKSSRRGPKSTKKYRTKKHRNRGSKRNQKVPKGIQKISAFFNYNNTLYQPCQLKKLPKSTENLPPG